LVLLSLIVSQVSALSPHASSAAASPANLTRSATQRAIATGSFGDHHLTPTPHRLIAQTPLVGAGSSRLAPKAPTNNRTGQAAVAAQSVNVAKSYSSLPMAFEPNVGQTDASVAFLARWWLHDVPDQHGRHVRAVPARHAG
jgi:hypothetical protein